MWESLNNWDALRALESLIPPIPSPSFTVEEYAKLPAFGEVPIMLHSGVFELLNDHHDELSTGYDNHLERPLAVSGVHSDTSVETCGTFGPRGDSPVQIHEAESWDSRIINTPSTISACSTLQHLSPSVQEDRSIRRVSSTSNLSASSYLTTQTECLSTLAQARSMTSLRLLSYSRSASPSPSHFGYARSKSTETLSVNGASRCSSPLTHLDPSFSWSTVSVSPGFLSPSPSRSSFDVTPQRAPITRLEGIKDRRPPRASIPRSPSIARIPIMRANWPRTASNDANVSGILADSGRFNQGKSPLVPSVWHYGTVHLPGSLSWLENIVVELGLDQEGFRSVHPRFVPSGYTHENDARTTPGIPDTLVSGLVELRPMKRYAFVFHHATLESSPMLRSLMLLGEDAKDYLSRQASLSIKQNGVYVVRGSEVSDLSITTSSTQHPHAHYRHFKYEWRFEYVVNDRKDSLGKSIPGEKVLTPLSFACTPGLLHPICGSGRKTSIMQQVKKVFTAKLAAERMHAPPPPIGLGLPTDRHSPAATITQKHKHQTPTAAGRHQEHGTTRNKQDLVKPTHRRFHSATSAVALPALVMSMQPLEQSRPRRRPDRAASIADVLPQFPPIIEPNSLLAAGTSDAKAERRRSFTSPAFKVVRHIVPPSELDDMISSPVVYTPRKAPIPRTVASPVNLTALKLPRSHDHNYHDHHERQHNQSSQRPSLRQNSYAHVSGRVSELERREQCHNAEDILNRRPILRKLSLRSGHHVVE